MDELSVLTQRKHPAWKPSEDGAAFMSKLKESSKSISQHLNMAKATAHAAVAVHIMLARMVLLSPLVDELHKSQVTMATSPECLYPFIPQQEDLSYISLQPSMVHDNVRVSMFFSLLTCIFSSRTIFRHQYILVLHLHQL